MSRPRFCPMSRSLAVIAAAIVTAAPAFALDMPARKAGLWELKMEFEGRQIPAQVMRHCTDAASDKLMNLNFGGSNEQNCSKQDLSKNGGTITIDSVCKFGEMTTTSHAVVTGSFDSAYTIKVTSTSSGGRPMPGQTPGAATNMSIVGKWLGPCAAGQKPGDVIMANGMKMNVLDMPRPPGAPPRRP